MAYVDVLFLLIGVIVLGVVMLFAYEATREELLANKARAENWIESLLSVHRELTDSDIRELKETVRMFSAIPRPMAVTWCPGKPKTLVVVVSMASGTVKIKFPLGEWEDE